MRFYLIDQLQAKRHLTFDLFLRLMGFVYFWAFLSLVFQIDGLYGEHGILPIGDFLGAVKLGNGDLSYLVCPTVLWISSSSQVLTVVTTTGTAFAILLMAGIFPLVSTAVLYLLYLSMVSAGQEFLSYQWDMLLLQAGFLAIIISLLRSSPASRRLWAIATFLIFWLDFHLMFSSGMCKLASGDPTWTDLTALTYHFFTQPLPTPLAIFANAMPLALAKVVCWCTLFIEIAVPCLIFAPRTLRILALILLVSLQVIIALTGNYCFFNLLTIVLLLPLADDTLLRKWHRLWPFQNSTKPRALAKRAFRKAEEISHRIDAGGLAKTAVISRTTATLLISIVLFNILVDFTGRSISQHGPGPLVLARALSQTFGIDNNYGLFAVMTRERPEIIVEGSDDGNTYKTYQFKFKVSRTDQAPPIVAPLQPRLDWQMWFEGLNATYGDPYSPERGLNPARSPWFDKFMAALQVGDKPVLDLLANNPFPDHPPKYLRARVVNYYMVSPAELIQTGQWWRTREIGTYFDSKLIGR